MFRKLLILLLFAPTLVFASPELNVCIKRKTYVDADAMVKEQKREMGTNDPMLVDQAKQAKADYDKAVKDYKKQTKQKFDSSICAELGIQ